MTKPRHCVFLTALLATSAVIRTAATTTPSTADSPDFGEGSNPAKTSSPLHLSQRKRPRRTVAFLPLISSNTDNNNIEVDGDPVWYEIRPSATRYDMDPAWFSPSSKPARKLLWHGRYDEEQTWMPRTNLPEMNDTLISHPLRTNSWSLQVQWTGKWDRILPRHLRVEFDTDTGYCRASNPDKGVVGIGQWEAHPWGLWFTLMDASGSVEYTFTSQLHLNPFGDAAKLLQGSVIRYSGDGGGSVIVGISDPIQDEPMVRARRKWFRPVVGRFSGEGKGVANVQYSQRMTGLSQ